VSSAELGRMIREFEKDGTERQGRGRESTAIWAGAYLLAG
jgi:hypothetical protein